MSIDSGRVRVVAAPSRLATLLAAGSLVVLASLGTSVLVLSTTSGAGSGSAAERPGGVAGPRELPQQTLVLPPRPGDAPLRPGPRRGTASAGATGAGQPQLVDPQDSPADAGGGPVDDAPASADGSVLLVQELEPSELPQPLPQPAALPDLAPPDAAPQDDPPRVTGPARKAPPTAAPGRPDPSAAAARPLFVPSLSDRVRVATLPHDVLHRGHPALARGPRARALPAVPAEPADPGVGPALPAVPAAPPAAPVAQPPSRAPKAAEPTTGRAAEPGAKPGAEPTTGRAAEPGARPGARATAKPGAVRVVKRSGPARPSSPGKARSRGGSPSR